MKYALWVGTMVVLAATNTIGIGTAIIMIGLPLWVILSVIIGLTASLLIDHMKERLSSQEERSDSCEGETDGREDR